MLKDKNLLEDFDLVEELDCQLTEVICGGGDGKIVGCLDYDKDTWRAICIATPFPLNIGCWEIYENICPEKSGEVA